MCRPRLSQILEANLLRVRGDRRVLAPVGALVAGQGPLPQRARRPRVPQQFRPASPTRWLWALGRSLPYRTSAPTPASTRAESASTTPARAAHRPAMVNLGLPSFVIVEPTGRAIQEARERVIRASVRNAGFEFLPAAGDGESTGSM